MCLHAANIDFDDNRVSYQEYQDLKKSNFDHSWKNGLPVLSVGGTDHTQSIAHLRYAGKKSGLYPKAHLPALAVEVPRFTGKRAGWLA